MVANFATDKTNIATSFATEQTHCRKYSIVTDQTQSVTNTDTDQTHIITRRATNCYKYSHISTHCYKYSHRSNTLLQV